LSDMNQGMVLVGFLVMIVCQDLVAFKALKKNAREGVLCAVVPGYLLIYGSREENRDIKPLIGWLIGMVIFLMGFTR
jgi:hypothetical protein